MFRPWRKVRKNLWRLGMQNHHHTMYISLIQFIHSESTIYLFSSVRQCGIIVITLVIMIGNIASVYLLTIGRTRFWMYSLTDLQRVYSVHVLLYHVYLFIHCTGRAHVGMSMLFFVDFLKGQPQEVACPHRHTTSG